MAYSKEPRWMNVERPYSPADVKRLSGSVRIEHTLAKNGADKLASDSLGLVKRSNLTDNRIYLNVPFSMKDQAKKKGAKWDCKKKSWFVYSDYKLKEELLEMFPVK